MIEYKTGKWNLSFIWRCQGSVFPRAIALSMPATIAAGLICEAVKQVDPNHSWRLTEDELKNGMTLWSGYVFVLGFLLVFRTQQAYSRFWEGSTLLQEVRGEWFNCTSSLFAFCTPKPDRKREVLQFQQLLVRLMSMLYCAALQTVYRDSLGHAEVRFEIIDPQGLDDQHLFFLDDTPEQIEVLVQWIQRLIVDNMGTGILPIPPPVITRAFQELSRGVVHLHNARKITEISFPFPYAQMMSVLLLFHTVCVPIFAGILVPQALWACLLTFVSVTVFWGINYIASEIEFPFGNDYNDLPMSGMTGDMNQSLITLLDPRAQLPPSYNGSLDTTRPPGTTDLEPASGEKTIFNKNHPNRPKRRLFSTKERRHSTGSNPPENFSGVVVGRLQRQPDSFLPVASAVPSAIAKTPSITPVLEPKEQPKEQKQTMLDESIVKFGTRFEELMVKIVDKLDALVARFGADIDSCEVPSQRPMVEKSPSRQHLLSVDTIKSVDEARGSHQHHRVKRKMKTGGSGRSVGSFVGIPPGEKGKPDEERGRFGRDKTSIFSSDEESESQGFLPRQSDDLRKPNRQPSEELQVTHGIPSK